MSKGGKGRDEAFFHEVLDDLSSRFLINLPEEELGSFERIFMALESAFWFYDDFHREQNPGRLPALKLRTFAEKMFDYCPLLHPFKKHVDKIYEAFSSYKMQIPCRGGILLNPAMNKCILVKAWKGSSWGFPKGKINKDEPDVQCAIREVLEETGFDMSAHVTEEDFVEMTIRDQNTRLYIAVDIAEETEFITQTRKEISKISWHPLDTLPTYGSDSGGHFYMVMPFVQKLKKWVEQRKRTRKSGRRRDAPGVVEVASIGPRETATVPAPSTHPTLVDSAIVSVARPLPADPAIVSNMPPILFQMPPLTPREGLVRSLPETRGIVGPMTAFTFDATSILQSFYAGCN